LVLFSGVILPITLLPGVPYTLNRFNLEQVFDEDHLQCQGITLQEVLYRNGLPEDYYTICLQAFDNENGEPLSAESPLGCSNTFLVLDLEAPVLLSPADGTEFEPATPQNITFVWTSPPGAPENTMFNFKIVEVMPYERNINDAVGRQATRYFLKQRSESPRAFSARPIPP
jgi:hypothetical protein